VEAWFGAFEPSGSKMAFRVPNGFESLFGGISRIVNQFLLSYALPD
jgi:hypothetical protein